MKKSVLLLIVIAATTACSPKKEDPMAGKKIVCDSIMNTTFTPDGEEVVTAILKCDTVPDTKQ